MIILLTAIKRLIKAILIVKRLQKIINLAMMTHQKEIQKKYWMKMRILLLILINIFQIINLILILSFQILKIHFSQLFKIILFLDNNQIHAQIMNIHHHPQEREIIKTFRKNKIHISSKLIYKNKKRIFLFKTKIIKYQKMNNKIIEIIFKFKKI